MELSCPFGTTRRVPQEKFPLKPYNKSFIDQACLVKMAGYWRRYFFPSSWTSTPSLSINTQKKILASNIQPSWPHTWSIAHIYFRWIMYLNCVFPLFARKTTEISWSSTKCCPCLPLARLKFKSINQNSAGGEIELSWRNVVQWENISRWRRHLISTKRDLQCQKPYQIAKSEKCDAFCVSKF